MNLIVEYFVGNKGGGMKTLNLFGEMVEVDFSRSKPLSVYQRFKLINRYRKSDSPQCKTCKYHLVFEYHDKYYHKCELLGISNSEATDIRVSYVCNKWEAGE
jgi:hypothetical protein